MINSTQATHARSPLAIQHCFLIRSVPDKTPRDTSGWEKRVKSLNKKDEKTMSAFDS
jgi:hypothetical protein